MIGELVAILIVVLLPAAIVLGLLFALVLAAAGLLADPSERRLVKR